jgi:hypothetical protein
VRHAETFFRGPYLTLSRLLARNTWASTLYDRLYNDRLCVSTTKLVNLRTLYCSQSHVDLEAVADYVARPRTLSVDRLHCVSDLPVVVCYRGRNFVLDGHHRLASKMIVGMTRAKVYFWDLDALLKEGF